MSFISSPADKTARAIDACNEYLGQLLSWLTLFMVLLSFAIAVMRYTFDFGSIALQESVGYMHGLLFMLAAAYTFKHDRHVRVDIFYQRAGKTGQAWIDLLGILLLLMPMSGFLIWSSWDYVHESWQIMEGSRNSGGLPGLFILKTAIPLAGGLLFLQGVSQLLKSLLIITGNVSAAHPDG